MKIETFVKRAMGKHDAGTFLAQHREFLCGFPSIMPVLAMLEKRVILPTPALMQILQLIALEKDPFEKTEEVIDRVTGEITVKSLVQVETAARKKEPKKYLLILFTKSDFGGAKAEDESYDAVDYGEAMRVSNRVLYRHEDALHMAVIGMGVTTLITRDQAMGELLGHGPGGKAATKKTAKTSAGLGWKCSAKGFVAKFSRG